jgi:hypothetical protein
MEFLLSHEEMQVVNEFQKYRNQVDDLLRDNIQKGRDLLESYKFDKAGIYFDKVIATLPIDGLTMQEKNLLAQAHTYKAKTLRIGSEASEDTALMHLELALAISPDFKEAISERDSILVDRTLPVSSPSR